MPNQIRKTIAATMILAPFAGLVSAIASPPLKADASAQLAEIARHSDRWYIYALLITVSGWLFVPAVIGLVGLVSERAPRLGLVGGCLALLGSLIAVGDATTELMYWQMGALRADRTQMAALSDRYENATGTSLVFTIGGLAVIVGLSLLAVAVWRLRVAPVWAAAGVPLGAIVNIAGFASNSTGVVIASNVVWLGTLGWIGWRELAGATRTARGRESSAGPSSPRATTPARPAYSAEAPAGASFAPSSRTPEGA
jgi:hypothetical protein